MKPHKRVEYLEVKSRKKKQPNMEGESMNGSDHAYLKQKIQKLTDKKWSSERDGNRSIFKGSDKKIVARK